MKRLSVALLAMLALLEWPLCAQERITSYDSQVQVNADGSLDVSEHISVRAEGSQIRRGIYREFPTRYRDARGNRVVVDLQVVEVLRDGRREPWFTERHQNGVRINTGSDDLLPTPANFTFTLRYRTTRQLGFFEGFDELYWNAIGHGWEFPIESGSVEVTLPHSIGHGWEFPIESGSVEVTLPQPVPAQRMQLDGYSGLHGDSGDGFEASITGPGRVRWQLTRPLAAREGLTVVLGFPKGMVVEPTQRQRWLWLLRDNLGVLVALAGLIVLLLFCVRRWHRVGRDPRAGVVIARYEPPPGHAPSGLRYMQRMGYDTRSFSADVLALAVAGRVRIHRDKGLLKDTWELEALPSSGALTAEQQALLSGLFPAGEGRLELKDTNAATISAARQAHSAELARRFQPALFMRNRSSIGIAVLIAATTTGLALAVSRGGGIPLIIALGVAMLPVVGVFAVVVKAPTAAGRALLDEVEGLKRYLTVAERDELKQLPGPDAPPSLDAARYEALLPYAVALEVEDAWTRKFTLAAGAAAVAAATAGISWYRGNPLADLGSFSKAVGSSLTSQISSSATPPGSSSGGGGGGFSGGGGGGGGGGGR